MLKWLDDLILEFFFHWSDRPRSQRPRSKGPRHRRPFDGTRLAFFWGLLATLAFWLGAVNNGLTFGRHIQTFFDRDQHGWTVKVSDSGVGGRCDDVGSDLEFALTLQYRTGETDHERRLHGLGCVDRTWSIPSRDVGPLHDDEIGPPLRLVVKHCDPTACGWGSGTYSSSGAPVRATWFPP